MESAFLTPTLFKSQLYTPCYVLTTSWKSTQGVHGKTEKFSIQPEMGLKKGNETMISKVIICNPMPWKALHIRV